MKRIVASTLLLLFLAACGITIVPRPLDPSDRVNPSDRSITIKRPSHTTTARVQDTAVGGFSLERPITSFYVSFVNNGPQAVTLPRTSFTLVDSQGKRYQAISADTVSGLMHPDFDLLVPFPFVSFLDVVDLESQRAASAMASERPYVNPELEVEAIGQPFPETPVAAGSRAAGVVFFEIDLFEQQHVRLDIANPAGKTVLSFPFFIEK